MIPDLDPLFFPKRIGIAGLSPRKDSWGRMTVRNLRRGGFSGELVAVAPRSAVEVPSVADLAELDAPLDLLLVALPAAVVPALIARAEETAAVRSALVFSSGFRESGPVGARLEQELVRAAATVPVVGPNCVGLLSRPGGTVATVSGYADRPSPPPAGPIAVVSQSGALGLVVTSLLERHGVSVGYYASVGNEACLGLGEIGGYLIEREDVATLGLYVESVRDVPGLRAVARRAQELGKHVVALKAGMSEAGRRAALSHTAAVTGDALLFERLCDDEGIVLARSDEAFADLLHTAQRRVLVPGAPRLAVVTMTGGGGAILADRLADAGASVPVLGEGTRAAISALGVSTLASDTNPVDVGGVFVRDDEKLPALFSVLADDSEVDGVVALFTFGDQNPRRYRELAGDLAALSKPGWLVWAAAAPQHRATVPPGVVFDTMESFVRGFPAAIRRYPFGLPPDTAVPAAALRALDRHQGKAVLTEADARDVVVGLGCAYAPTMVIEPGAALFPALLGDFFAVKVDSPDVVHRAASGLVRLGVGADELRTTVAALARKAADAGHGNVRLIVQPMLPHRVELVVGAVRDPQYGPVVVIGEGGMNVEDPAAFRFALFAPARPEAVADAVARVQARFGRVDGAALADLVSALAALMAARGDVREVDINPVLVRPDGSLVAVDALVVLEQSR
ncbi:acetate--CoA ligase family protein [Amycolatopsis sp. NPDC004368]